MSAECQCVICHDYGDRADAHPVEQRLVGNVGTTGWGVIAIPDDNGPWAFTVGLWHTHRQPEVTLFGLDPQTMIGVLNSIGTQVAEGASLTDGLRLDDILDDDYRVALAPVDDRWRENFFGTASRFYRSTRDWPVLQCLWPDGAHRFPGEPEFDPKLRQRQPHLWLTPDEHPETIWTS